MGNDGGSIPKRSELVKEKVKQRKPDESTVNAIQWFFCALSKKPLHQPVASCALGKLYNKDAVIEYLLDKSAYGDGDLIAGHIKSMKNIKTLHLTPNPAFRDHPAPALLNTDVAVPAPFICSLTRKEMNGRYRFVYLACGHAFSETGLKQINDTACPECGKEYTADSIVVINPRAEELAAIKAAMEAKALEAKSKSKRKRENEIDASKKKTATDDMQSGRGVLSSNAVASIARSVNKELESKDLKGSAAIKGLYATRPMQKERNVTSSRG